MEKGFHATPTSNITKDAGVSAGILFHYFPSKEALIHALFLDVKNEFYRTGLGFDHTILQQVDKASRLFWENIKNWSLANPLKFRFIKQFHSSPFIESVYQDETIKEHEGLIQLFFQQGIEKGIFKETEPDYLTESCYNQLIALVDFLLNNPKFQTDKSFLNMAWQMYWDSLIKTP